MKKILVIGGGAAGMFAAIAAGRKGYSVSLFEKNEKLGKKLFITGKGRCNLTNACDMEVLFESVVTNSRFLYSSFYLRQWHSSLKIQNTKPFAVPWRRIFRIPSLQPPYRPLDFVEGPFDGLFSVSF